MQLNKRRVDPARLLKHIKGLILKNGIIVELANPDRDTWAIRRNPGQCLNWHLEWETEPPHDLRDEAFLERCRFTRMEAFSFAMDNNT